MINGEKITFQYKNGTQILKDLDLRIEAGKLTAILGKNGSGKSTLVRLITALLPMSDGELRVCGSAIRTEEGVKEVRRHCGIVFQNPDNQFVSPIVEEDIKFGLENHEVPEAEHESRIHDALSAAGLTGFEKRIISTLSGGQKQLTAAAGIFALHNNILIFDEASSMLDPEGKAVLMECIKAQCESGKTVILITQNIAEAAQADCILLMNDGHIAASGSPREVLTDLPLLEKAGIRPPLPVRIFYDLKRSGIELPFCPLTTEELAEEICSLN